VKFKLLNINDIFQYSDGNDKIVT